LIIGPQKTFYFFARKQKIRGTICFIGGILLVFLKWPFIGMIVETFGFLNLFGYGLVIWCSISLGSSPSLVIQRFLSRRYYFSPTTAIRGDLLITTVYPGGKALPDLSYSNAQTLFHVRW
jgi:Got1/Sft2-like family